VKPPSTCPQQHEYTSLHSCVCFLCCCQLTVKSCPRPLSLPFRCRPHRPYIISFSSKFRLCHLLNQTHWSCPHGLHTQGHEPNAAHRPHNQHTSIHRYSLSVLTPPTGLALTDPTHKTMGQMQLQEFSVSLVLDGRPSICRGEQLCFVTYSCVQRAYVCLITHTHTQTHTHLHTHTQDAQMLTHKHNTCMHTHFHTHTYIHRT